LNIPSRDGFQGAGSGGSSATMSLNKSSSISVADCFDLRMSVNGFRPSFEAELCCLVVCGFGGFGGTGRVGCRAKKSSSLDADWNIGGRGRGGALGFNCPGFAHFPNSSGAGRNRFGLDCADGGPAAFLDFKNAFSADSSKAGC
jgi:hypothetical protein